MERLNIRKAQKIMKTEFFEKRAKSTPITGALTMKKYAAKLKRVFQSKVAKKVKTELTKKP